MRKADRLVVMDRGQVVEIGNHDDLQARGGAYHALYQAQTRLNAEEQPPVLQPQIPEIVKLGTEHG